MTPVRSRWPRGDGTRPASRAGSKTRASSERGPSSRRRSSSQRRSSSERRPLRFGLLGGTFDPPHLGHLAIAEWAREQLELDRVLFIPTGAPPHKLNRSRSPAAARLAMMRLAARGNPAFDVTPIETRRTGPSFTIDTIRALRRRLDAQLFLIMGADSLDEFHTWRDPDAIAAETTLAVARRPGAGGRNSLPSGPGRRFARNVVWLDNPGIDLSSSAIRERVRDGRSLRYLVPDAVVRFIERRRLYGSKP